MYCVKRAAPTYLMNASGFDCEQMQVIYTQPYSGLKVFHEKFTIDKGVPWEDALARLQQEVCLLSAFLLGALVSLIDEFQNEDALPSSTYHVCDLSPGFLLGATCVSHRWVPR